MTLWHVYGVVIMAGFAGFFVGMATPIHPLNQDLRKMSWFLFVTSLAMLIAFLRVGVVRGQ